MIPVPLLFIIISKSSRILFPFSLLITTALSMIMIMIMIIQPHVCSSSIILSSSSSSSFNNFILPLRTQEISSESLPSSPPHKLSFRHNISLTVTLQVGSPAQNVTMVLDTGSELSWLYCNQTARGPNNSSTTTITNSTRNSSFDPTRSSSYSNVTCSSSTCTNRTRDFAIPVSCDADQLCHTTLSYADMSSAEGTMGSDVFRVGPAQDGYETVFGCMFTGFSTNPDEDSKTTGLMGMNRGSLSFVSQMGFRKFSYCISGTGGLSGLLLLGDANFTWLAPLNYTPLIQIPDPLPYFNRVAYTVQFEGIKVSDRLLTLSKSLLEPDHTGAGQTMVDSGTQFTYLLGPVYESLRAEFLNQTRNTLRVLDDPNFVFEGGMDLCYLRSVNETAADAMMPELPSVSLMFHGAEMRVSGDPLLYRVPGETRNNGNDAVYCFTFGNSDLLGVEAYVIGHHHQQNVWMEFDLFNSRIGLAQVQCDLAVQKLGLDD